MVLSHKCSCSPSLYFLRSICTSSLLECNHYKALGLTPSATQAEIKSAYYELSKIHHPDKNQGSEKSAKKFRDITTAYEILGNKKSRKKYDLEHFSQGRYEDRTTFRNTSYRADYNDEVERMFYERTRKRMRKVYYGKTPYYDFDAWFRGHYSGNKSNRHEFEMKSKFYYDDDRMRRSRSETFEKVTVRSLGVLCLMSIASFIVWLKKKFSLRKK